MQAALIGIPRGADGVSSAAHTAVLQRLFDDYPHDPLALYVAALACHVQPQPCTHPEYYARLTAEFPDNAVHWVLVPKGAKPTDLELAAQVVHAGSANEFDDRLPVLIRTMRAALRDQQIPESILQPMQAAVEEAEVAPSLRRNAIDSAALPIYAAILHLCKPDNATLQQVTTLRDACGAFAQKGMRSANASILARMVSSAILRRLYKGTPLEAEAKEYRRQFVWLSEHIRTTPEAAEKLQEDIVQFGEWEAWQRQAEYAGVARAPPPGWLPANPQQLLLSEERAAITPQR